MPAMSFTSWISCLATCYLCALAPGDSMLGGGQIDIPFATIGSTTAMLLSKQPRNSETPTQTAVRANSSSS